MPARSLPGLARFFCRQRQTHPLVWTRATTVYHLFFVVVIFALAAALPLLSGRGDEWFTVAMSRYTAWDSNTYLKIATQGYQNTGEEATFIAFYPLWPAMIAVLSGFGVLPKLYVAIAAAVVLSWIGHRWLGPVLEEYLPPLEARRVWHWYMLSPIAVYFFFPYTEALFLCITTLFFWFLYRGKPGIAAGLAALAALNRMPGLMLLVPLVMVAWKRYWHWKRWWLMGLPVAAFGCYLLLNWYLFANPFQYQVYLKDNWFKEPVNPVAKYIREAKNFHNTTRTTSVDRFPMWMDIASALGLPLLAVAYCGVVLWDRDKDVPWEWVAWTMAQGLLVWSQSYWLSSTRYVWIAFPVFVMLERITRWSKLLQFSVEVCFAALAGWGIWMFANGMWMY